jgi:hypothetical protein
LEWIYLPPWAYWKRNKTSSRKRAQKWPCKWPVRRGDQQNQWESKTTRATVAGRLEETRRDNRRAWEVIKPGRGRKAGDLWKWRRCGKHGSQEQAFHPFHISLEIPHKTRDSHISTAPATGIYTGKMKATEKTGAVGKWKSKTRIPTFPQLRGTAAQQENFSISGRSGC